MIAHLSGLVINKNTNSLIINVHDVGYLVKVTNNRANATDLHQNISLHIHSHIKEDDISLYGFINEKEKEFFMLLIKIKGIGPKVALEIMNSDINKVKTAIINKDDATISQIPGIGKKTAERLILELKNKIEPDHLIQESSNPTNQKATSNQEVIDTLTNLGYDKNHIHRTLSKAPVELEKAEELIEYFIKNS